MASDRSESSDVNARLARGRRLRAEQRPAEALASLDAALAVAPGHAEALGAKGFVLMDLDRFGEALETFDLAAAAAPDAPGHRFGQGVALMALDRPGEALSRFDDALERQPAYATGHAWRGFALVRLGRHDEAALAFEQAGRLAPEVHDHQLRRVESLMRAGRCEDALAKAEEALQAAPSSDVLHLARALPLLAQRRFEEGWAEYEHRPLRIQPELAGRVLRAPRREDVAGRRVLLFSEQGVGDVIMHAGAIPDLLADAAAVGLACDRRLDRLFAHSFPGVALPLQNGDGIPVGDYDVILELGSLGFLYRRALSAFSGAPYLQPTAEAHGRWAKRLPRRAGRLRVGLSWRGGVQRTGAIGRSMRLAALAPLMEAADADFVSLQYGDVAAELAAFNAGLRRPVAAFPAAEIDDFDDLAALMGELDLVVSVQTAVVHLAGALGVPCLAMLPRAPEWRYGLSGETMPWYGSVRLLRQQSDGDWAPVIGQAAAELGRRA